jgi:putative ABC transport system permease protein
VSDAVAACFVIWSLVIPHILEMILKQGATLILIGVFVGLAGALVLTRLMSHMLYGISPNDPIIFALIALMLTIVALVACYIPARRAARVDPVIALRAE